MLCTLDKQTPHRRTADVVRKEVAECTAFVAELASRVLICPGDGTTYYPSDNPPAQANCNAFSYGSTRMSPKRSSRSPV